MTVTACRHDGGVLPKQLAEQAAARHGLVTRAELTPVIGRGGIQHRLDVGALVRIHRDVYRVAAAPRTGRQRLLAAVLAAGDGAVASMRNAAALFELEEFEADLVELAVPPRRRVRVPRAVVHQSDRLPPEHVTVVDAIPSTTVARTLCDLTAVRPRWAIERAVDRALTRRLTTRHELDRTFLRLSGRGRRRCRIMRVILDARNPVIEAGESPMECRVAQVLVRAGLPCPEQQYSVRIANRQYRLDLAYPEQRVVIEYDGWDAHSTRSAFDRDRCRQNRLSLAGWRILRFTSATSDRAIVAEVSAALKLATHRQGMSV